MLNQTFIYDQDSVRLQIDGLPDYSVGQSANTIGILSSWKLDIAGFPQLEGNKEHLFNFLDVLYSYSRYYLSGIKRTVGEKNSLIQINPCDKGHLIRLTSTKEEVAPLDLIIDDAELSDLIICTDKLISDDNVNIDFPSAQQKLVSNTLYINKSQILTRVTPSLIGAFLFIGFSSILLIETKDKGIKNYNNYSIETNIGNKTN
tara:strand:- start:7 stop:615 length:609 start_codon:yes stop_codon:yes gene_type:complete